MKSENSEKCLRQSPTSHNDVFFKMSFYSSQSQNVCFAIRKDKEKEAREAGFLIFGLFA